jgi:hypothetical protein
MSVSKTFPPLTMNSDLPIAVEIDESPDQIREDLLDRLYWNVSGLQSDITVRDGNTRSCPLQTMPPVPRA